MNAIRATSSVTVTTRWPRSTHQWPGVAEKSSWISASQRPVPDT
jgi:hypothetical protein